MNKINKIIREEIERYILSEAIDFSGLNGYANQLNKTLALINNASSNNNYDPKLRKYFYNFVVYCVQIIAAINRCVQSKNLNEAYWGGLSNYGINLPGELGGNISSDFKQGYRGTKNWIMGNGRGNVGNGSYGNGTVNGKTVPTVKLSILLSQFPQKQQEYANYNFKYNITNNNPKLDMKFKQILGNNGIIYNIQKEYQAQVRNAQGNP